MICLTMFIECVNSDSDSQQKIYELFLKPKNNIPKVTTEFHNGKLADECLNRAYIEAWISDQLVEVN